MNVEQADETPQKAVLALEADEDSDQDDFASPGKYGPIYSESLVTY